VYLGQPENNCTHNINDFMKHAAKTAQGWFWTFFAITFICFLYTCFLWDKKHHSIESPLLGHHH